MKKYLLCIMLMPLFVKAQYLNIMDENNKNYKAYSKTKGNVKSIIVNGGVVYEKDSKSIKTINTYVELLGFYVFTTINYNRNGNITDYNSNDTLNHIYTKSSFKYDSLYRLIESGFNNHKTSTINIIKYKYDSINRIVEREYYDSLSNVKERQVCLYNGDTSINYYILSPRKHNRIIQIHKNNSNTTLIYTPKGNDLLSKTIETKSGDTIDKKSEWYNTADKYMFRSSVHFSNSKMSNDENIYYNKSGEITSSNKSESLFKYNEMGDVSEETIHNDRDYFNDRSYWVKVTYKYIYDSHGNYVKKTGYVYGKLRYETNRTIEYYD